MSSLIPLSGLKQITLWFTVFSFLSFSFCSASAPAAFLPSQAPDLSTLTQYDRDAELDKIQTVLETKIVAQRLSDLGLTPTEVMERMAALSSDDLHQVSTHMDALQPGGDALGTLLFLAVVAVIVVVVLQMSGHKVIITK